MSMDSQTGAPAPVAGWSDSDTDGRDSPECRTFTGSQDSWGWKALLLIFNVPISRDVLNSPQGIQNPPGWDLEQRAVADSALSSCEEAHLNPKECTTKHAFYILLAVY